VTAFDAIHDQTRPLEALINIYGLLKEGGWFSMVDIAAGSHLAENKDHPMGPFLYTVSLLHCMPVGRVNGGRGLGMMWGRQKAVKMLQEAGFKEVEILDIPVAGVFLILTTAWGANRCFGVFLEPMIRELGWSRAGLSGAFTLAMIAMGLTGIMTGKATDRFGPRIITIGCGIFLGLGYMLCAIVRIQWQVYLFYGIITGMGMSVTAPLLSLVARWFIKKRALMTSIIVAGPGLGNMVMPLFFSMVIGVYGWRYSYLILGAVTCFFILIGAMFVRREPGEMGLLPHGADQEKSGETAGQFKGLTLRGALHTRQYWQLSCIYFCDLFLMNVVMVHIVIHAMDHGIPATKAASILSVASGVCMFSRVIVGGIADRIGYKQTFTLCLSTAVIGFILLLFANRLWSLYLFAVIFGFSLWSAGGLIGPILAQLFGLLAHGAIYGSIFVSGAVGGAFGPVLVGFLYDRMGSYRLAFVLCLCINLISLTSVLLLKPIAHENHSGAKGNQNFKP